VIQPLKKKLDAETLRWAVEKVTERSKLAAMLGYSRAALSGFEEVRIILGAAAERVERGEDPEFLLTFSEEG